MDQACGKARHRLHILISGKPRRFIGICRIVLEFPGRFLKESIDTAYQLFIVGKRRDDFFSELNGGSSGGYNHSSHRCADSFQDRAELSELSFGFVCRIARIFYFLSHVIGAVRDIVHFFIHVGEGFFRIIIVFAGFS